MLLDNINHNPDFNDTEKVIAEYILKNLDNIENLTIQKLAKETFTSNTTIIRFCRKLGLDGFKKLKIQLIKEVENSYNLQNKIDFNIPFSEKDSNKEICRKMADLTKEIIDRSYLMLNNEDLNNALPLISDAERIFIFAKGDSYISALNFANKMMKINKYVILADKLNAGSCNVLNATKSDIVIFLTYSGKHYDYTQYALLLKKKGIQSLLITASEGSTLNKLIDLSILVPNCESIDDKIAPFASQISFNYILNIIYSYIFKKDYYKNYEQNKSKDYHSRQILGKE